MKRLPHHIAIIGMQNIGKTYWAAQLASEYGYEHKHVLSLICRELDLSNTQDLADWLGSPEDKGYFTRQTKYLHTEEQVLLSVLANLQPHDKVVIDTTSSFAHLSPLTQKDLVRATTCIHLYSSGTSRNTHLISQDTHQKPEIWSHFYHGNSKKDKTFLLEFEEKKYRSLAESSIDISRLDTITSFAAMLYGGQIWPYEDYLRTHVLRDLERGRPNWDRPHTERVVSYIKLIDEQNPAMNLDRHVLVTAAYLHDWGYSTLFRGTKALYDHKTIKAKHAIRSAKHWQTIQNKAAFRRFSQSQKDRITHLVTVHDKVADLVDTDELILMEADTLGALATESPLDTFSNGSYIKYLKKTKKQRIKRFVTQWSRDEAKILLAMHRKHLGVRAFFI